MTDSPARAEVEVVDAQTGETQVLTPDTVLPPGVQPSRNYVAAVELGAVLAASGIYKDAKDPAKAAVKVMIGMDLGLAPTAALQAIHLFEDGEGNTHIITEGKVFAALIKRAPGYDYKVALDEGGKPRRDDQEVAVDFFKDGEKIEPTIVWNLERAKKAGLLGKKGDMYTKRGTEMLTWKCLSEGTRLHFPELMMGNPIYLRDEFGEPGELREASAPDRPQPLQDAKAENLRDELKTAWERLKSINPRRVPPGMYANVLSGAEHSHARLEAEVGRMGALADQEQEQADLVTDLEKLDLDPAEFSAIVEKAETRKVAAERIDLLKKAIAEHQPKQEAATDGPAQ